MHNDYYFARQLLSASVTKHYRHRHRHHFRLPSPAVVRLHVQQGKLPLKQRHVGTTSILLLCAAAASCVGRTVVGTTTSNENNVIEDLSMPQGIKHYLRGMFHSTTSPNHTLKHEGSQQSSFMDMIWMRQEGVLDKFLLDSKTELQRQQTRRLQFQRKDNNKEIAKHQSNCDKGGVGVGLISILDKVQEPLADAPLALNPVPSSDAAETSSKNSNERILSLTKSLASSLNEALIPVEEHKEKESPVRILIHKAFNNETHSNVQEAKSYTEVVSLFREVQTTLEQTFGELNFSQLVDPLSIFYYLEHEDEHKTPSWKRRMHRYHSSVDVRTVNELNDSLSLADLAYTSNTIEEVQAGLEKYNYELLYFEPDSGPGKPSHFVALKRGQSSWSYAPLEVLLVVRGTNSFQDVLTDALLVPSKYRDGLAHDGIVRSGQHLVATHTPLFKKLLELSGKRRIRLDITGHSLGAAVASIAGIEFQDYDNVDVQVVGFGCPALLSQGLSENTKGFITTVINDSDVIPRTSGVTLANVAMDIMEYDWTDKGRRDLRHALDEVQSRMPYSSRKWMGVDGVMKLVDKAFPVERRNTRGFSTKVDRKSKHQPRMEPILYPPGKCIHFYRDGSSISGSVAPCTFFNEIDVTRTMITDHMITHHGYKKLFLQLMREYHRDEHFAFASDTPSSSRS